MNCFWWDYLCYLSHNQSLWRGAVANHCLVGSEAVPFLDWGEGRHLDELHGVSVWVWRDTLKLVLLWEGIDKPGEGELILVIQTLRQEHCHKSDDTLGFMVKTCPQRKERKERKEGRKENLCCLYYTIGQRGSWAPPTGQFKEIIIFMGEAMAIVPGYDTHLCIYALTWERWHCCLCYIWRLVDWQKVSFLKSQQQIVKDLKTS